MGEYHRVEIDPKKFHVVQIFRCVDTHVIVEGTVGPVEVSNSEQIELLLNRLTPSVIFSTVKGAVIHVTQEEHLENSEFVTSTSTNVNVVLEFSEDRDEVPLPDQYET